MTGPVSPVVMALIQRRDWTHAAEAERLADIWTIYAHRVSPVQIVALRAVRRKPRFRSGAVLPLAGQPPAASGKPLVMQTPNFDMPTSGSRFLRALRSGDATRRKPRR